MASRVEILRSRAAECRSAAQLMRDGETKNLLHRIADQYHDLANQLELLGKLRWPEIRRAE